MREPATLSPCTNQTSGINLFRIQCHYNSKIEHLKHICLKWLMDIGKLEFEGMLKLGMKFSSINLVHKVAISSLDTHNLDTG